MLYLKKGILNNDFRKLLKGEITYNYELYEKFKILGVSYYFLPLSKTLLENKTINNEYRLNLFKNILLLDLKNKLEILLKNNNINFIFYKGAFTTENVYDNIAQRHLSDIDLLVDENQLDEAKKLIDHEFKITKYKKDESFYYNKYRFYENEFLVKYKGYEISVDLHIGFIQKAKFKVDYSVIFNKNCIEHQIIAIIIQVSNDYFINTEKKFLDLYLIFKRKNIDFNYLLSLITSFKIKKISYLTFYILINELNLNKIPIDLINLETHEKLILKNMIMTNNFRVNQIFLFYYTFDEITDYKNFIKDKLLKIRKNGIKEVTKSLKKIR